MKVKKEYYKVKIISQSHIERNIEIGDIGECVYEAPNGDILLYNPKWNGHTGGRKDLRDQHCYWFEKFRLELVQK